MIINWDGKTYDLDLQEFTLQQGIVIQDYCGLPVVKLLKTIIEAPEESPELLKVIGAVYWLMLNQAGQKVPIATVDFPVFKFLEALVGAFSELAAEAPADEKPDPTKASPSAVTSPSPPAPRPSTPAPQEGVVPASTGS